jgi:oxygen-independent coproporphyrinogen-3 oxidase
MSKTGEVGLYFHIPFCSRKCPYCHFFVIPDDLNHKASFLHALRTEWNLRKAALIHKRIVSIYFGGGTPTKLAPQEIASLLDLIGKEISLAPDCEITLEANPEDVTGEKMRAYAQAGVNRVSLGIQSLVDTELQQLGRQHNAAQALQAVHTCHAAGLKNLSIDLMFELPYQTLTSWRKTLQPLKELPITHLSLYNLTIEPHTLFFKKRKTLEAVRPDSEERLTMLQTAIAHLEAIGLSRYEVSAFAQLGYQARHNSGYWLGRPFLGLGPSACSYWDTKRSSNHAHFQRYLDAIQQGTLPIAFQEELPYPRDVQELFAIQLRLLSGIHLPSFEEQHGPLPDTLHATLQGLQKKKWLCQDADMWRLTEEGLLFYDSVAVELI